ncbi:MAG: DUF3616 domain-containing protein [Verrucomicrobiales bacterium]|nr:DUF3616 domain-containing protein [Verrucomicrobiales bacterium]
MQIIPAILLATQCLVVSAEETFFYGSCDASAAVALDENTFVVADDEDNILRIYSLKRPGMPLTQYSLDVFLGVQEESHPESDIEACTRVGDLIYWITSHSRNKKGKWRNSRYRFFATKVIREDGKFSIQPEGIAFDNLLGSLASCPDLDLKARVGIIGEDSGKSLAPKENGLNIEGLSTNADGSVLYIGLRNPIPEKQAVLIPLKNPNAVIHGKAKPMLGTPVHLKVQSRGIRSIEYSAYHRRYFLVAGDRSDKLSSVLYSWDGVPESVPKKIKSFINLNPEAIAPIPGHNKIRIFSDDGTVAHRVIQEDSFDQLVDGKCACKSLKDPKKKRFRSLILALKKQISR